MSASIQLLQFVVDPFTRENVTLGALVRSDGGERLIVSDRSPGAGCMGGASQAALFKMLAERLRVAPPAGNITDVLGSHVVLGDSVTVPAGVADPFEWARRLMASKGEAETSTSLRPPPARRDWAGNRFFETYKVRQYVRARYRGPNARRRSIDPITHWVQGSEEVLLMEPILGAQANYREELKEVAQRFFSWRTVLAKSPPPQSPILVAYVFPGHREDAVPEARELLAHGDVEVVDVDLAGTRDQFLNRIVSVARSVTLPLRVH